MFQKGGSTPEPEPDPDPTPDPGTGGEALSYTWDLSTNSYSAASTNQVTWSAADVNMVVDKGTASTAPNNYLGGDANNRTSSRFYTNSILTITPEANVTITSVVFTATSTSYASALKGSTWTNASASVSSTTVTVTPTNGTNAISAKVGGTCGFTGVTVHYTKAASGEPEPVIVKTLKSIAVTGMKTTYEQGDIFKFNGTCTATYSVTKDGVAQADETAEVTPTSVSTPNMNTIGTQTITVTYETVSTTYDITITENEVTPGTYNVLLDNVLWNVASGQQAASVESMSGKANDITFYTTKGSSQMYANATQTRFYKDQTFTISVPEGYLIKSITFAEPASDKKWEGSITVNTGTYTDGTKTWTGSAQEVTYTFGAQNRIATATVTYIKDTKYSLTITEPAAETGKLIVKDGAIVLESGAEIYEGTTLSVTATPNEGYEDGVIVVKNASDEDITSIVYADGVLTMPAEAITISATFERKPCSLLSTPTISATTTYNTATLTWNAVTNAEKYSVQIGTADAVETTETSYEVTGLNAETTYTYQVQAIAADDQFDYCDSELAEGSFTTSQAPIATLILSENGETHDLDGEHRLYEIVTLPNTAAACTETFVGWSADANCTTAPEYAPGASYTLSELTQTLYAVYATATGIETKYIKLTTTPSPSFAGTYLIVNEEKQVAFNGGLTTLDTEGNTISVEITNDTIESNDAIENATFLIIKRQNENNYLIKSKSDKYIGRTTDANELDESTEKEYTNTISIDADGNANIIGSGGAYLRYNATSGQERFRYYKSTSYTSQKAIALYKKYSIPLYTNYTTYCGDDITISSGTTQTFNTDQQINTLIIEGGATANLVAGNIEINTIILKGGLNADATDYKMPILYTNGATIDVDHLYLDLAINHNTYYPFAVPFPVSVSDIDYANPTLAAASEYGTHYLIKRYDGAKRAEDGVNKDVNWVVVETDETLQPGVGYIISALTGKSETTTTIQIPLTFVPEQNSTLSITAHTGTAAANDPIQKGWNFIAHPYLSEYAGSKINNAPRYVSIPTYNFSAYQQTMLMATTLSPEYPFFVQIGKDTEINFTTEGRRQTPASVRADENNQILNLLFKILLADEEKDQTGIILDNNCTPAYEIDADLEKMFGSAFTTSIYTLCQDKRLAFNAMSFENAQSSPIPLGYRAAEAGEYTINLDIIEDTSAYEHLYEGIVLYDSTTEIQTNLLYADYTFTTDKIQDDTRFSIQFVPKNNTSTNIEDIENIHTTQKIIYNNQLYILHNGQIYNPIGQSIR